MVEISDDIIVFIGGTYAITHTIMVNITDDFSMAEGPPMLQPRYYHSCGSFELDGKIMVVVTGGYDGSDVISTELWDPESNEGFIEGTIQVSILRSPSYLWVSRICIRIFMHVLDLDNAFHACFLSICFFKL